VYTKISLYVKIYIFYFSNGPAYFGLLNIASFYPIMLVKRTPAPLYGGQSRESHLPIYHLVEVNETNKKKNPERQKKDRNMFELLRIQNVLS